MKPVNKSIQVACDGGGATGKSTGAKMISKKYKLKFLSSGLLYRYAGFMLLKHKPKNQLYFLKDFHWRKILASPGTNAIEIQYIFLRIFL